MLKTEHLSNTPFTAALSHGKPSVTANYSRSALHSVSRAMTSTSRGVKRPEGSLERARRAIASYFDDVSYHREQGAEAHSSLQGSSALSVLAESKAGRTTADQERTAHGDRTVSTDIGDRNHTDVAAHIAGSVEHPFDRPFGSEAVRPMRLFDSWPHPPPATAVDGRVEKGASSKSKKTEKGKPVLMEKLERFIAEELSKRGLDSQTITGRE